MWGTSTGPGVGSIWPVTKPAQIEAVLVAAQELCAEAGGLANQIRAREVAERADLDPYLTVDILQELYEGSRLNFRRSGGGDPDHSLVICPLKEDVASPPSP